MESQDIYTFFENLITMWPVITVQRIQYSGAHGAYILVEINRK